MATATMNAGGMTRREFLFYIWGASMALLTVEFGGLLVWFMIPRFREGEFGGKFGVKLDSLPKPNDPPANFPDGRFWLVNLDTGNPEGSARMYLAPDESQPIVGIAAIYKVCTHLGCIYAWNTANDRFECPCHGSKYRLDGRRVESPAPRTLDRFELSAVDEAGNVLAVSEINGDDFYAPLVLPPNTAALTVDTGARKQGPSQPLICSFRGNCP